MIDTIRLPLRSVETYRQPQKKKETREIRITLPSVSYYFPRWEGQAFQKNKGESWFRFRENLRLRQPRQGLYYTKGYIERGDYGTR